MPVSGGFIVEKKACRKSQLISRLFSDCGALRLEFGNKLSEEVQDYLASQFNGTSWAANGPLAITTVLKQVLEEAVNTLEFFPTYPKIFWEMFLKYFF